MQSNEVNQQIRGKTLSLLLAASKAIAAPLEEPRIAIPDFSTFGCE